MKKSVLLSITVLLCSFFAIANAHAGPILVGYVNGSQKSNHSIFNLAAKQGDTGYTAKYVGNKLRIILRDENNPNWSNCLSYGIAAQIGTSNNHYANWPVLTFNQGASGWSGGICGAVFDIPAWQVNQMGTYTRIKMVPFRWDNNNKVRTHKDFDVELR